MKKFYIIPLSAAILLSSCGTYTGSGAMTGGTFGSILGSAIGGIAGGSYGSDIGTIIGMAGGAAVGAAVGSAADKKDRQDVHDHYERVQQNKARGVNPYANDGTYSSGNGSSDSVYGQQGQTGIGVDESGFDSTNSGDDRIYDFQSSDYTGNYSAAKPTTKTPSQSSVEDLATGFNFTPNIEIVNARFVDDNQDGTLSSGEVGKIIFEIMNRGSQTLYDVVPSVIEANDNRHIYISPSIHVESLSPGKGIRYTAVVKADKKLKSGSAKFALTVLQGNKSISKVTEFNIPTKK